MKKYEHEFYQQNLKKYTDARRFGWLSDETQRLRWTQLLHFVLLGMRRAEADPSQLVIFDYGCGDGGFFKYLDVRNIGQMYIGVDAMAENIEQARENRSDLRTPTFYHHFAWDGIEPFPFETFKEPVQVDFVVESGAFATTPQTVRAVMLRKLLAMGRIGFAGTFLAPSVSMAKISPEIIPATPAEVLRLVDIDEHSFILHADYLQYDFAIGAFKRDPKNT